MTTDQTILYLTVGLTVFFLATVLLFILYSRTKVQLGEALDESWNKDYTDQETFLKTQDLSFKYSMSEASVKTLEIKLERLYADRNQLRKDFIEQSEIATAWRQKHDKLAVQAELLHNDFVKMSELVKEANEAVQEVKIKELDHLFKNPFTEKKPKGWNLKVYPRDEKGRVRKASDFIYKEFEPMPVVHLREVNEKIQGMDAEKIIIDEALEPTIDWSKPQPFPKDYRIPKGTECVNLIQGTWGSFIIPELTKVATIESSFNPFVKRLDGKHRQNKVSVNYNDFADKCFNGIDLAPINPTDHPLHPDFKDPSEQEPDPNSPNEIAKNWDKLTPYPKGCIVPINEPSINVSSDNKLIKIGELGYLSQSKANYTKVWFFPIDSKLVQERTRRDYIECEVHNFAPTNPHHHPDHPFYGIPKEQLMLTPDGWKLKGEENFLSINLSPRRYTFNIPDPNHF